MPAAPTVAAPAATWKTADKPHALAMTGRVRIARESAPVYFPLTAP